MVINIKNCAQKKPTKNSYDIGFRTKSNEITQNEKKKCDEYNY